MRYRAFCDELRLKVGTYKVTERLNLTFRVPMPPSWSEKKRIELDGTPHQQRPDIDNYLKAFLDALCEEDSYVWDVRATKLWSREGGIEINDTPSWTSRQG